MKFPALALLMTAVLGALVSGRSQTLQQRPATPPESTAAKAEVLNLPPGTKLMVRLNRALDSSSAILGQSWDGVLVNDIPVGDHIGVKSGTGVDGLVVAVKRAGRLKDAGSLSLRLIRVEDQAVATDVLTRDASGHIKSNVTKIGGGGAAGALIGGLTGGVVGAAVGGAVGAGAGTMAAASSGKKQATLPAEDTLTFTVQ